MTPTDPPVRAAPQTPIPVLITATILTGIGAGLIGMVLAQLIHLIQHLAYGYSMDSITSQESFLQGVSAASPLRRVLALLACGLIAGIGWGAAYRFARPLVSIRRAIATDDPRMPMLSTTLHALLQIVTVSLGSPLGREGAPREIGAAYAGWLCHRLGLASKERRILVACGAGAGLAAVYNVPLGGALFTLEVLLGTFSLDAVIPAMATCVIAAVVAWIGLGNITPYLVPQFAICPSLVIWAIVAGPLFGYAGYGYARLASAARKRAPRDWRLVTWCPAFFLVLGLLAIYWPQLLGNGKGPTQLGFDSDIGIRLAATLLLLKLLVTTASLRAGAEGGLLTPALTLGALLAIVVGGLWNLAAPPVPLGAFAIIGAAAFLASSTRMPLTAIALIAEFTRINHDFLIPVFFAVAGAMAVFHVCNQRHVKKCGTL